MIRKGRTLYEAIPTLYQNQNQRKSINTNNLNILKKASMAESLMNKEK